MGIFRVIVAGTRFFNDYNLLKRKLDIILKNVTDEIVIISGMADGADLLGIRYAKERGYKFEEYPADWDNLDVEPCVIRITKFGEKYNKMAGLNRNLLMSENAHALVAFHNGKSTGTSGMIKIAKTKGLLTRVILY